MKFFKDLREKTLTPAELKKREEIPKVMDEEALNESITKMSNPRLKFHATKDFPHGSYTKAEIKDEHKRRMKTEPNYHNVKPSMNEEEVKKPGLWDNIHARRKKGLPPKKPGEEGYPKTLDIDEAAPKIKQDNIKAIRAADNAHDNAMGRTATGRKKPVRQMTSTQKSLASLRKEEAGQLDELSPNTLGRYASKSLRLGDIANRMSKSDNDGMGKIANKRLSGVNKAVDKMAVKTGRKSLATFIKKDVNKTKASGDAYTSGTGTDDHGKSYNKAMRNIGKMREEVQVDEATKQKLFMFKTEAEAKAHAEKNGGKVVKYSPTNYAVLDKDLTKKPGQIPDGIVKESVELDEAKRDGYDFEAMDPPNGIDYDDKNLRKLNWKMYDDKAIRDIIKRADSNADERSPHGPDYQASGKVYYQNIIKAAKAELKKRGIKEEVELDEVTVANSPAAFDLKKRAEAYKRNMIKFQQTPGQDAHDKFLKARTALINSLKKLKQMDLPKAELDALRKGTNIFESAEDVDEAPKSNSMIRAALVAKALKNVKKEATYSDTGWQKPAVKKDQFGNVIKTKNVAKSAAKSGLRKTTDLAAAQKAKEFTFGKVKK